MNVGSTGSQRFNAATPKIAASSLKKTQQQLKQILEKLSTGQKINRASDDAAGLSISEQLRTNIRGFKMATQNVENAMAALDISDGAANQISDILQRQRELAISARNGTLNDQNRKAIDTEYQALTQEVERISQGANYNRLKTSNGSDLSAGTAVIQTGSDAGDQVLLPAIDFTRASATLGATSLATSAGAQSALSSIDTVLQDLNKQRSTIGATVNKFESTINNLSVSMVNTQAAESVLRDQDIAEGMTALTRSQLLQEGSMSAFKRFNEISRYQIMGIIDS